MAAWSRTRKPPPISKELFDQVQAQRPRFKCPKKNARAYPLRGKVYCGCCGHAMPRTAKKKATFYCRYTQVNESAPCHGLTVTEAELEGMEAMYAGLPVVASAVKGHTDLIEDGVTGLLYPYGDEKICAERMLRLTASEQLRQTLARNAKETVEQYGLDRVLPVVWADYAKLAEDRVCAQKP